MQSFMDHSTPAGIDGLLGILTIGQPARYRSLAVYPLKANQRVAAIHYLVLDDAIGTGAFRITEVSEGGTVPQLRALNETEAAVFLLDGEQLIGAKQNRVLNLSLMLAPKSETEIPVACVEAGRWRTDSADFRVAEEAFFAHGRAEQMAQVSDSLRRRRAVGADQRAVWDTIAAKSARMDVSSPTRAMRRIYESRQDDVRSYLDAIPIEADQIGAAYAIGGSLIGIEIFDADTTFKKLAGKLAASYALDAMELDEAAQPPDIDAARAFIQSVRSAQQERSATAGIGETVRLSTDEIVGAALEVDGRCVHLSAFDRNAAAGSVRARRL
jgi:ARG and Rhodanese-Phosphatase-superfamily-associated Protein domain